MKILNKRIIKNLAIAIFATLLFPSTIVSAKDGNWGISHSNPGTTPTGNESAEYLKEFNAYYVGNPDEKVIYLTFDAGFENGYTESVLDSLKKNDVPATFFLVGTYIRDNAELVKRMVDEGHIVANHTMSHPDMSAILDKDVFIKELSQTENFYKSVTGKDMPKYYRPPRGTYSESNMKMANELGYKTIFWSLAYVDWNVDKQPSKEEAFSKLIPRIHPGAVVLLHNTSKTNADILDELIGEYKKLGYEFKSLDDLTK